MELFGDTRLLAMLALGVLLIVVSWSDIKGLIPSFSSGSAGDPRKDLLDAIHEVQECALACGVIRENIDGYTLKALGEHAVCVREIPE